MLKRGLLVLFLCISCSRMNESEKEKIRKGNEKKEKVCRLHHEKVFPEVFVRPKNRDRYPWEVALTDQEKKKRTANQAL